MKYKPIKFPQDEQAHKAIIEWWYFNGNLKDEKGNTYSYMNCLFKCDPQKVKIPFLKKAPLKTLYFTHSLISDIKNKKFYSQTNLSVRVSKESFSKPLLFVEYNNSSIKEEKIFNYHMKTKDIDLKMASLKKPLLENKIGYIDLKSKTTFYYSLTNLQTKGTLKIEGKEIKVKGKSWMDHQWADTSHTKDKWTWFSIQLDNDTEIVCFEYDDGKVKTYLASVLYPDNKQTDTHEVIFTPLQTKWKSTKTGAEYPLSWQIVIPSEKITLKVSPLLKTQEMLFGLINYWEGGLEVSGAINKQKVKGTGFLELVGYPMQRNKAELLVKEIKARADQQWSIMKKKIKNIKI